MTTLGETLDQVANAAVQMYRDQTRRLGVSRSGEGSVLAALFAVCHAMEPHILSEQFEECAPGLVGIAAEANPDVLVHDSDQESFVTRTVGYALDTLEELEEFATRDRLGDEPEVSIQRLSELYQIALHFSFGDTQPPDIPAFMREVDDAIRKCTAIWLRMRQDTEATSPGKVDTVSSGSGHRLILVR
jgi:hypothetical protein